MNSESRVVKLIDICELMKRCTNALTTQCQGNAIGMLIVSQETERGLEVTERRDKQVISVIGR